MSGRRLGQAAERLSLAVLGGPLLLPQPGFAWARLRVSEAAKLLEPRGHAGGPRGSERLRTPPSASESRILARTAARSARSRLSAAIPGEREAASERALARALASESRRTTKHQPARFSTRAPM